MEVQDHSVCVDMLLHPLGLVVVAAAAVLAALLQGICDAGIQKAVTNSL